jgi:hypothetical protein
MSGEVPDSGDKRNAIVASVRAFLDRIAKRVPMRLQRIAAGLLIAAYFITAGSRLLEHTLFGIDPGRPYAAVILAGFIFALIFGPGLVADVLMREEERKRREEEYEKNLVRDPEEDARIRRHIGMSPNNSLERGREG